MASIAFKNMLSVIYLSSIPLPSYTSVFLKAAVKQIWLSSPLGRESATQGRGAQNIKARICMLALNLVPGNITNAAFSTPIIPAFFK